MADSDFERFFQELETTIMEDIRRTYSETVIDHFQNPRNLGCIEDANGFGRVTGPCGDTMEIYLKVVGDRVVEAKFMTDGCGATIACGSMATELVRGKSLTEALKIDSKTILQSLGGLPEADVHCSVLAAHTLQEALKDYLSVREQPWKRLYRKSG